MQEPVLGSQQLAFGPERPVSSAQLSPQEEASPPLQQVLSGSLIPANLQQLSEFRSSRMPELRSSDVVVVVEAGPAWGDFLLALECRSLVSASRGPVR